MADKWDSANRNHQMSYASAQQDHINMQLRQMGASVTQIHGLINYVRFPIGEHELFYVYNLNAKNEYYLQRVKPYPMSAGVFPSADAIAEFIEMDLKTFQNAMQSGHFASFLDINRRLIALTQELEETYLHCNVPGDCFRQVGQRLSDMERALDEMNQLAKPLPKSIK